MYIFAELVGDNLEQLFALGSHFYLQTCFLALVNCQLISFWKIQTYPKLSYNLTWLTLEEEALADPTLFFFQHDLHSILDRVGLLFAPNWK